MRLRRVKTVLDAQTAEAKIQAICWSPNSKKLAVCDSDRNVLLFDEHGERRDKFSTKPAESGASKKSYVVKSLAFSPDSIRLAVAQTDNIVFVYRLGEGWGEKKVICNKFSFHSPVTCMVWPSEGPLVVGLAEGKVRASYLKSNKSSCLYSSDSYVVSLASSVSGRGVISGHADGSVIRFFFEDESSTNETQGKVLTHTCPPYALAWASHAILAAGCDKMVTVYSPDGSVQKKFDHTRNDDIDFTVAASSPNAHSVIMGSFNCLRVFYLKVESSEWEEGKSKFVENWYTISSLAWSKDGSKVAVGSLCGAVELFDCSLKKFMYKNKFEIVYIDPSQIIIRDMTKPFQCILKSHYGHKIVDIKVYGKDRYAVARTASTLLLGDMETAMTSEIPWNASSGKEKFYFGYESVCFIFHAGEMFLVEYGNNTILECVRTELTNPHLISFRCDNIDLDDPKKTLAYLIDLKTISVVDVMNDQILSQMAHDSKIDWLELNETGKRLLFRDKRQRLSLGNVFTGEKKPMLNYCSFVQWVPNSDVVVAQNRGSLCVWYNVDSLDKITILPVKGEVIEIQRYDNKTDVVVRDSVTSTSYELDETLIEFGTAISNRDFKRAIAYLDRIGYSEDTEDMWCNLGRLALEENILHIAERCFSAIGDMSKAQYLRETIAIADEAASAMVSSGLDHYMVKARLAILAKDFKTAERLFLEQDKVEEAITMYQGYHKWDEAIELAQMTAHPSVDDLREKYLQWLLTTEQEERAGEVKEREGDYEEAVRLYLAAGLPSRAARVVSSMPILSENDDLVQNIASSLMKGEFYEHAGDLYEKIDDYRKALECYRLANSFARAVELARKAFPEEVVHLEEEWADHLMSMKQLEAAIHHYIEAGKTLKALDAAVNGKLWQKAFDIMEIIEDPAAIGKYFKIMAHHYLSVGSYDLAEHLLLEGGMTREAVEMYNRIGEWEKAYKLAIQYLDPEEVTGMYITQATKLEEEENFRDAEKLYVSVERPELAIMMYKNLKLYDHMIRLIKQHAPHTLEETYQHLASQLETDGNHFQAEQFYLTGNDWKAVVNMYRNADMWEDAFRVAKTKGTSVAAKQVAYLWAKTLGSESGVKLLSKLNLLESSIDYATENCSFDFAFELANVGAMKQKLPAIHLKYAQFLEDEGKFAEAELEFIKAQMPKEAVLMYVHNQDWESAQRVAESYDQDSVADVLIGQARFAFEQQDYQRAESLLLRAEKPELAMKYFKEVGMWSDALRVCKEYLPNRLALLQEEYDMEHSGTTTKDVEQIFAQARSWEESGQHQKAVDCYMQVSPENCSNEDFVVKCWMKASELALKFLGPSKTEKLFEDLTRKLVRLNRHKAAAQLFIKISKVKNAIDCLIDAGDWTKAKHLARELNPQYEEYIDNRYKDFLKSEGKTDQLADLDVTAALDMLVEKREWKRCLEMAESQGSTLLHKYLAIFATELLQEGHVREVLKLYVKYGTPAHAQNLRLYRHIIDTVLIQRNLFCAEAYDVWANLRDMLFNLCQNIQHLSANEQDTFNTFLIIAHYYAIRSACMTQDTLDVQSARICISLLRYTTYLRVDKAFYEAGLAAKRMKWDNMAFVFWNHYLDVCEAIEENNQDMIDYSDFDDTDIPTHVPIPSPMYLDDRDHEEVKEWVLAISMDQKVKQELTLDERSVYEACLVSPNGRHYKPCIVTGYPVLRNKLDLGIKVANKDDWNKILMAAKMADSSECQDVVKFAALWCGSGSLNYSFQ